MKQGVAKGLSPKVYGTSRGAAPPVVGKYWGFRCGFWRKVLVTTLPRDGGTGGLTYAPVDRRGYPFSNSAALCDCQAVWGPVKAWGASPPRVSRKTLSEVGVSPGWLTARGRGSR